MQAASIGWMQVGGILQHGWLGIQSSRTACWLSAVAATRTFLVELQKGDRLEACPTSCYNRAAVETLAKRFFVSGRVQGVGFRFFAERTAARLGVSGFVRNLHDGRVEVYAVGSAERIDAMRDALRIGPRMAEVYRVDEEDAEILREFANVFSIESDE